MTHLVDRHQFCGRLLRPVWVLDVLLMAVLALDYGSEGVLGDVGAIHMLLDHVGHQGYATELFHIEVSVVEGALEDLAKALEEHAGVHNMELLGVEEH